MRTHDLVPANGCGTEVVLQHDFVYVTTLHSSRWVTDRELVCCVTFRLLRREELTASDNFTMLPASTCAWPLDAKREALRGWAAALFRQFGMRR